jgi:hypothetical protein
VLVRLDVVSLAAGLNILLIPGSLREKSGTYTGLGLGLAVVGVPTCRIGLLRRRNSFGSAGRRSAARCGGVDRLGG